MARPPLDINADDVEKLAAIACTTAEIAAFVGCSADTLERRFMDVMQRGREKGKASLRRMQWKSAEKGNVTMQIWLGKQLLKQTDHAEVSDNESAEVEKITPAVYLEELRERRKAAQA